MRRNLRLVEPTAALAAEFRDMATEWRDAGESKFEKALDDFEAYVAALENARLAENLPPDRVPGNTYWLLLDGHRIVGTSRLRHWLLPHLEKEGGHIGYDVRPSERRKGHGTRLLALTLERAVVLGLREVLVTCDTDNVGSVRIIERNGGRLIGTAISDRTGNQVSRYRIVVNNACEVSHS
jgi:predicted acetyltransferase